MRRLTIPLPGTVVVADRDFFGGPDGHTVGGSDLWIDDSDSTFAEIYATCHPDAWFSDTATAAAQATTLTPMTVDRVTVVTRMRVQTITSSGAEGPIAAEFYTTPAIRVSASATAGAPGGSPEWHEAVMPFASQADFDEFLARVNDGTLTVKISIVGTVDVTTFAYPGVRVFEAEIVITRPGGYAPPCRNIKRGDALDLGGARNYPPSKMQQTSSRGVGAY